MNCILCNDPMTPCDQYPHFATERCEQHSYFIIYNGNQDRFFFYYKYADDMIHVSISDTIKMKIVGDSQIVTLPRPEKVNKDILEQYLTKIYKMKVFL